MIPIKEDNYNFNDNGVLADKFSEIFGHINAIIAIANNCPQYDKLMLSFESFKRYLKKHK